jgi:hypothetical protein
MLCQVDGHPQLRLPQKIPGPARVITMEARMRQALDCEQDSIELAAVVVTVTKLWELSLQLPTVPLSPTMPPSSGLFKADEDAKDMQISPKGD